MPAHPRPTRNNKHMERTRLLKIHRFIAVNKTAIAKQHGAQQGRDFWRAIKERIDFPS